MADIVDKEAMLVIAAMVPESHADGARREQRADGNGAERAIEDATFHVDDWFSDPTMRQRC